MAAKLLTYADSSVLINAVEGPDPARKMRAIAVLGDQNREFAASRYLVLEVLPIPIRYNRRSVVAFYERFFKSVSVWTPTAVLLDPAYQLACRYGLGALDAIHLAAAMRVKAEFVSAERPTKPVYSAYNRAFSIY